MKNALLTLAMHFNCCRQYLPHLPPAAIWRTPPVNMLTLGLHSHYFPRLWIALVYIAHGSVVLRLLLENVGA